MVAPVRIYGNTRERFLDTYAALDTAADGCLCSSELPQLLGLEGNYLPVTVVTATGTIEDTTAQCLTLGVRGYRTDEVFPVYRPE